MWRLGWMGLCWVTQVDELEELEVDGTDHTVDGFRNPEPHQLRLVVYEKLYIYINIYIYTLGVQSPCQMMIGVSNHLLSNVFRFHYHSQKVIGSLGIEIYKVLAPSQVVSQISEPSTVVL